MATVNFSVPENIKKQFNQVFAHENKSQIIADLMKKAIEEHRLQQQRAHAINVLLELRSKQKPVSLKRILKAKKEIRG